MNIKDLGLGDSFYCLTQEGNEYKVAEHRVAELGIDLYGEHVKFVNNGQIESMQAKYCEKDFSKCAAEVEKVNQGYSVCSACGSVIESDKTKSIGQIKLCDKCIEAFKEIIKPAEVAVEDTKEEIESVEEKKEEIKQVNKENPKAKKSKKNSNPLSGI